MKKWNHLMFWTWGIFLIFIWSTLTYIFFYVFKFQDPIISRDQTNRGYKKTNRNRNIYDPYSFSFNRNRIFQNGIPIRFNRIRIFHFSVPFKRKRIQYFNRIIRLNRISNYLTEFGPNNSVQPNIRSFGQIKRNWLLQA